MRYSELLERYKRSIRELIHEGNWSTLTQIFEESPSLFDNFSNEIETCLQKDRYKNPIEPETEQHKHKQLHRSYLFALKFLEYNPKSLSLEFITLLHERIFTRINELYDEHFRLFVRALGYFTIEMNKTTILDNTRLTKKLVEFHPELMVDFFPKIVEKEDLSSAFKLIEEDPQILKRYRSKSILVLQNFLINNHLIKNFKQILKDIDPALIDILDKSRDRKKQIFYHKLMDLSKENPNFEWFENELGFRFCSWNIDSFSDLELQEVISKLLDFGIPCDHHSRQIWINYILLDIGWSGRRYLFTEFIQKLIDLRYHQVVSEYFQAFPEEIKKYPLSDFIKLNILSRLMEQFFNYFEIDNPIKLFKELVQRENVQLWIPIFYQNLPELQDEFTKVLEDYIDSKDLSESHLVTDNYFLISTVLDYNSWRSGPKPQFDITFIERKLKEYLTNKDNQDFFNPLASVVLAQKIHLLSQPLQDQIYSLLIDKPRLQYLPFFAYAGIDNFLKKVNRTLLIRPHDSGEMRGFIAMLREIVKQKSNDTHLIQLVQNRLQDLSPSYEQAQLLSFLGAHNHAHQIYQKLLETMIPLQELLLIFVDYLNEFTELNIDNFNYIRIEDLLNDLNLLQSEFPKYNENIRRETNERRVTTFNFKIECFRARLYFLYGQILLVQYSYDNAKANFKKSGELFGHLMKYSQIPDTLRKELEFFERIARFFFLIYTDQFQALRNAPEILLSNLKDAIIQIRDQFQFKNNIKISRFLTNIEEINIVSKLIKFEKLASFCPIPMTVLRTKLDLIAGLPMTVFEWDGQHNPVSSYHYLPVDEIWNTYILIIEVKTEHYFFNHILRIITPPCVKIGFETVYPLEQRGNELKFELKFGATAFSDQEEIVFEIKEDNICGNPINLILPIRHRQMENKYSFEKIFTLLSVTDQREKSRIMETLIDDLPNDFREIFKALHFIYKSNKIRPLINRREDSNENYFHTVIYHLLFLNFGDDIEDESNVAKGLLDIYAKKIPVELKFEKGLQDIDLIFRKYKRQIIEYCYRKERKIGILYVYESTEKNNYQKEDIKLFYEEEYICIVFVLRGNLPLPSTLK